MYEPVERRKTYELVAEQLLGRIAAGRLAPGDQVPTERELTEAFRVGRSSVREALRMLESKGVLRTGANGLVVADVGNTLNRALELLLTLERVNLRELFEVRRILEGEAAALAVERHSPEHLARMTGAIEQMERGLREADQEAYVAADVDFHLTVAEATGNRIAVQMMLAVRDLLHRALVSVFHIPGSPERSNDDHRAIRQAIASGSSEQARRAMIEHLARVENDIRDAAVHTSFAPLLPRADERAGRR